MRIVYPPKDHTTYEANSFVIGSVLSEATLTLNGHVVPISKQGFFSYVLNLEPGPNSFVLEANGQKEEIQVERLQAPALEDVMKNPEEWAQYVWPQQPVGIQAQECIHLGCLAPEGATVTAQLGNSEENISLQPTFWQKDTREGVFAQLHQVKSPWPEGVLYSGVTQLSQGEQEAIEVVYTIVYNGQTTTVKALGHITVVVPSVQNVGVIQTPEAITRTTPNEGARQTPLLQGTMVPISGFQGEHVQLAYGPNTSVWVEQKDIAFQNMACVEPVVPIQTIEVETGMRSFQVVIPMPYPVPLHLEAHPLRVTLRLYGVTSHCNFIHYKRGVFHRGLNQVAWQRVDDSTMDVTIYLDSQLRGVQRYYDTERRALVCSIRTRRSIEHFPFVVAIDPGHGGEETGATAPEGTLEKDLNLSLALQLREALAPYDKIEVFLTRESDEAVGLQQRVEKALAADASLLLSLHHNGLPDGRSPLTGQGVSTYYYHPFAFPLARLFQRNLVQHTQFKDYGLLYDSLHMCRVMEMPALLLELGFLSHLDDAERCLDPEHQQSVVGALVKSLTTLTRTGRSH